MATENNILGLRAQIIGESVAPLSTAQANQAKANMEALDMDTRGELVVVMNGEDQWQAFMVRNWKVIEPFRAWSDTKEGALNLLLESLSWQLYQNLEGQNI